MTQKESDLSLKYLLSYWFGCQEQAPWSSQHGHTSGNFDRGVHDTYSLPPDHGRRLSKALLTQVLAMLMGRILTSRQSNQTCPMHHGESPFDGEPALQMTVIDPEDSWDAPFYWMNRMMANAFTRVSSNALPSMTSNWGWPPSSSSLDAQLMMTPTRRSSSTMSSSSWISFRRMLRIMRSCGGSRGLWDIRGPLHQANPIMPVLATMSKSNGSMGRLPTNPWKWLQLMTQ